jgi:hypothetical protein
MKSSKRMEGKRLCQGKGGCPVTGFGARLDVCEWILRDEFVQEADLVDRELTFGLPVTRTEYQNID